MISGGSDARQRYLEFNRIPALITRRRNQTPSAIPDGSPGDQFAPRDVARANAAEIFDDFDKVQIALLLRALLA